MPHVNSEQSPGLDRSQNFIMRLRKYLEKDPSNPLILESVRGRGYRFKENDSATTVED